MLTFRPFTTEDESPTEDNRSLKKTDRQQKTNTQTRCWQCQGGHIHETIPVCLADPFADSTDSASGSGCPGLARRLAGVDGDDSTELPVLGPERAQAGRARVRLACVLWRGLVLPVSPGLDCAGRRRLLFHGM